MRLFTRLFTSHLLIAVLALVISSGYTGWRVYTAFQRALSDQLLDYGQVLAGLLAERDWTHTELRQLQNTMDTVERRQSAHIWVVDRQGLVRMASASSRTIRGQRLPPEGLQEVLRGEPVVQQPTTGPPIIRRPTVGVPIIQNGEVTGAVFLAPAPPLRPVQEGQPLLFFLTGFAIAALAVAGISYYVSQRIARPLSQVSGAVRQVAQGDFNARVDYRSRDEVGELATGFNEMAAELGRLEASRKELMTHVSHELKGPLARVSGYLEAIHDGIGGQEGRREHFQIVRQEVGRLTRLVNDLLDVSRLEAGRLKLHPIACDLAPYLSRAAAVFEAPANSAQVTLTLQLPSVLPIVQCEPERVEQVLVNLLQNGLAHTPPGGSVQVRALVEERHLAVTVTDTGPGIPPEELPLIWERFHKVDRARTPRENGSGLGLTIVRQLVELQGGEVWVDSAPEKGSTFGFRLPLATPEM